MAAIPKHASFIPLERKLADMLSLDVPEDGYDLARAVLRGGDGGEYGLLLYALIGQRSDSDHPLVILDVGTARGFSAMMMARSLLDGDIPGHVYSVDIIDHHESRKWHGKKHEEGEPLAGIEISRAEIWSKWFQREAARIVAITERSSEVLRRWGYGPIDVAFLDGSHTYASVKEELSLLHPLMTDQGIIILDDYHLGATVVRVRSRVLNVAGGLLGYVLGKVWPSFRNLSPAFGKDNEYVIVKQRFHGIKKAVEEFLREREPRWSLEVVPMPSRGDYQGDDYCLAVLTHQNSG